MIVIQWTPPIHLALCGKPHELRSVSDLVRTVAVGQADTVHIPADRATAPAPYESCLASLVVGAGNGPLRITVEADSLQFVGGAQELELLAANLNFPDDCQPLRHVHLEAATDDWIAEESVPLVVMAT